MRQAQLNRFGIVLGIGLLVTACDVSQTREGELPDVDVDVDADPGQLPAYDVDWADVDVGTRTTTVEVPKVVVVMEEEEVEVPYLDVDMPHAGEKEERTIGVELEVEDQAYDLQIEEIYATGERLVVVSRLTPEGPLSDENQRIRVSDRVVISAPELDVRHYIIGERPEGDWNRQYTFVDEAELEARLRDSKRIYRRQQVRS